MRLKGALLLVGWRRSRARAAAWQAAALVYIEGAEEGACTAVELACPKTSCQQPNASLEANVAVYPTKGNKVW